MRTTILLVCLASTALLGACSSSPPRTSGQVPDRSKMRVEVSTEQPGALRPAVAREPKAVPMRAAAEPRAARSYQATRVTGDYAGYASVEAFIDRMVSEEGFDADYLSGVISRVDRQQWILNFLNKPKRKGPAVPTGAWTRYRAKFLTDSNIAGGVRFWNRYASVLNRASAQYGVPPEYIVAILGVETRYGGYVGKHKVVEALSTLAFDYPRRSEYFTGELAAFMVMSRDEGVDPFQPVGSYAGAMGLGQFMPSSFHNWAVDFNGDGKRDLWNPVDAIGSVANYFASHGWRPGEQVTVRARVDGPGPRAMKTGFDTSYSLEVLGSQGVQRPASLGDYGDVSLIRLDAKGGYQYWLGLRNFYVITRYNHSSYYAMAVHQLAQSVRARHGPGSGARVSLRGAGEVAQTL